MNTIITTGETINLDTFFKTDNFCIHVGEQTFSNDNMNWKEIYKESDYYLFFCSFYQNTYSVQIIHNKMKEYGVNFNNIYFLCNSIDEVKVFNAFGIHAVLCHHNAFINSNIFTIRNTDIMYDAVYNTRPVAWKRPFLARKIKKLAIIEGYRFEFDSNQYFDLKKLEPLYINDKRLDSVQVASIYAQSSVGLALSPSEGGCLSSGEYLLCGLPVVSTKSTGGRDTYYNEYNSILCEDNENSVAYSIQRFISNMPSKTKIRDMHIQTDKMMWDSFIRVIDIIFKHESISENAEFLFYERRLEDLQRHGRFKFFEYRKKL